MKLVINDKSEILAFTVFGDVDNSLEYEGEVPEDFRDKFKPKFYMLVDGVIVENQNYVAPEQPVIGSSKQDKINTQIILDQAKQKADQDKFNAQILLKLAGGMK